MAHSSFEITMVSRLYFYGILSPRIRTNTSYLANWFPSVGSLGPYHSIQDLYQIVSLDIPRARIISHQRGCPGATCAVKRGLSGRQGKSIVALRVIANWVREMTFATSPNSVAPTRIKIGSNSVIPVDEIGFLGVSVGGSRPRPIAHPSCLRT